MPFWDIFVILLLIAVNGFLALSELSLVQARRGRLKQLASEGSRGAARALELAQDPTGFLSTVQVGITLIGVLAGAYSGRTLAAPLAELLRLYTPLQRNTDDVAFVLVVVLITYVSLVLGELVPKRIALGRSEGIAVSIAGPMTLLARVGTPLVWFLRISTEAVLRLLGIAKATDSTVTEEEVKTLIAEGTEAGVFHPAEKEMIDGVLRLADRSVRAIMVPRPDVIWLDVEDDPKTILQEIVSSGHSRFPVCRGDVDEIVGIVQAKDLLGQMGANGKIDLAAAVREPLYVDEGLTVLRLLDRFKASTVHMAIAIDEYGTFEGIVTPTDILTAIAGALPEREGDDNPQAVQRADGSWLLDGRMAIDDVERTLGLSGMYENDDFTTLAGFILFRLGHLPDVGAEVHWKGWRFEVIDLDGRRIDKVLAAPL